MLERVSHLRMQCQNAKASRIVIIDNDPTNKESNANMITFPLPTYLG